MFKYPVRTWEVGPYEFREFNDPRHGRKLYDFLIDVDRPTRRVGFRGGHCR